MPSTTAWTFWLNNRQVTGVIVAEYGEEKLVEYGKRLYVVKGKDPNKKHFTRSTIPAFWKKVINGEAPPSPAKDAAKEPSKAKPKKAEKPASNLDAEPSPATHFMGIPMSEIDAAIANRDAVRKAAKGKTAQGVPAAPSKKRAPKAAKEAPTGVPPVPAGPSAATKSAKSTKSAKAAPSPSEAPNTTIWLKCPYCSEMELISALELEPRKGYIRVCKSCKREFGVRIVPTTTYHAEVAAFPGGSHE